MQNLTTSQGTAASESADVSHGPFQININGIEQVTVSGSAHVQITGPAPAPTSDTAGITTDVALQSSNSVVAPFATPMNPVAAASINEVTRVGTTSPILWTIANDIGGGVKGGNVSGSITVTFTATFTGGNANFFAAAVLNLDSTYLNVDITGAGAVATRPDGTIVAQNLSFQNGGSLTASISVPLPSGTATVPYSEAFASTLTCFANAGVVLTSNTPITYTPQFTWSLSVSATP
jgi:hypothetical protein